MCCGFCEVPSNVLPSFGAAIFCEIPLLNFEEGS